MTAVWAPLIAVHAIAASLSLLFGAFQLLRRTKGGAVHRIIGRVWVGAMYVVIFTSFGIQTLNGGFSWLHALSALTLVTVTIGLWAAVRRNIKMHKSFMQGSYFGILGAFGGVVAVPSRRIPQMAAYDLPTFIMWVAGIIMLAFAVIGTVQFVHQRMKAKRAKTDELEKLRVVAEAGLNKRLGVSSPGQEYLDEVSVIRDTANDDEDLPLMHVLAEFTDKAKASTIRAVVGVLRDTPSGRKEIPELTVEHFFIHEAMMRACIMKVYDPTDGSGMTTLDKRRNLGHIIRYAMRNIDDGRLLLSIVEERDVLDFWQALDILKQMKLTGPTPLAEGAL